VWSVAHGRGEERRGEEGRGEKRREEKRRHIYKDFVGKH
jgi:hypothetical protein